MITIEEVRYFMADAKMTVVVDLPMAKAVIDTPIKELLERARPQMFWQIHRWTIVDVQEIDSIARDAGGHVIVRMKTGNDSLR